MQREGGRNGRTGSGNGRANPLPVPLVQFRREKGCKKNEDAKGTKGRQQECPLSRGCSTPVQIRPGKWTARGAASLPRTVSHRATKVTDPLFPCAVLYRVFRTSSPRNGRPPLHGRIERASMPTFFSTILRSPLAISFPFLRPLSSSHRCRRIVFLAR